MLHFLIQTKVINLQSTQFNNTPKIQVKKNNASNASVLTNVIAATPNDTQQFILSAIYVAFIVV